MGLDRSHRPYTRTDLFLVRIWSKGGDTGTGDKVGADAQDGKERAGELELRGQVQRVVDGEAHQFNSWQGLLDVLLAMLSTNKGR